jgi:hypothetical protein
MMAIVSTSSGHAPPWLPSAVRIGVDMRSHALLQVLQGGALAQCAHLRQRDTEKSHTEATMGEQY